MGGTLHPFQTRTFRAFSECRPGKYHDGADQEEDGSGQDAKDP
jgi:hypothetical protein